MAEWMEYLLILQECVISINGNSLSFSFFVFEAKNGCMAVGFIGQMKHSIWLHENF